MLTVIGTCSGGSRSLFVHGCGRIGTLRRRVFRVSRACGRGPCRPNVGATKGMVGPLVSRAFTAIARYCGRGCDALLGTRASCVPRGLVDSVDRVGGLPLRMGVGHVRVSPTLRIVE